MFLYIKLMLVFTAVSITFSIGKTNRKPTSHLKVFMTLPVQEYSGNRTKGQDSETPRLNIASPFAAIAQT